MTRNGLESLTTHPYVRVGRDVFVALIVAGVAYISGQVGRIADMVQDHRGRIAVLERVSVELGRDVVRVDERIDRLDDRLFRRRGALDVPLSRAPDE